MTKYIVRLALSGLVLVVAWPAAAQDRKWGVLFAYPGAIGIQWDVSSKFAIRFDGDYNRNETEFITDTGSPVRLSPTIPGPPIPGLTPIVVSTMTETTSYNGSIGVSGVFALVTRDQLKIYLAPRAGVTMAGVSIRTEFDVSGIPPALLAALTVPANEERSESNYAPEISAKFGAFYRLGDRFGVFGEAGFGYTGGISTTSFNSEVKHHSIGLRSGIGGILYF